MEELILPPPQARAQSVVRLAGALSKEMVQICGKGKGKLVKCQSEQRDTRCRIGRRSLELIRRRCFEKVAE